MERTVVLDPPAHEVFSPGVYVTDGRRLFRVVSRYTRRLPFAELEDCRTLEVQRYSPDHLHTLGLSQVASPAHVFS